MRARALSIRQMIKDKLQVVYDGKPVEQMHLVEVQITNSGNQPVRKIDFDRRISLGFGSLAEVFSAEVAECQPKSLRVEVKDDGKKVSLEPTLLNSRDSVRIRMLVSNFEEVKIDGRIAGVKEISEIVDRSQLTWYLLLLGIIMQISGLGFAIAVGSFFSYSGGLIGVFALMCLIGSIVGLFLVTKMIYTRKKVFLKNKRSHAVSMNPDD